MPFVSPLEDVCVVAADDNFPDVLYKIRTLGYKEEPLEESENYQKTTSDILKGSFESRDRDKNKNTSFLGTNIGETQSTDDSFGFF